MTVLFAVLVFLIAGFSEVYAVYEGALWGLLLIVGTCTLAKERRGRLWARGGGQRGRLGQRYLVRDELIAVQVTRFEAGLPDSPPWKTGP